MFICNFIVFIAQGRQVFYLCPDIYILVKSTKYKLINSCNFIHLLVAKNQHLGALNGDFYVALGSSMGLALLIWVGGGLLKQVVYFFGNEPSLGQKSPILHLPPNQLQ